MPAEQEHAEEKHKDSSLDRDSEGETKEHDIQRHRSGKKTVVIPRSDSVGSATGRKYLAPTLSDPAARSEKERQAAKKRNARQQSTAKNNLPHVTEGSEPRDISSNKTAMPKGSNALTEVHDWWNEQIGYDTQSSDEEE